MLGIAIHCIQHFQAMLERGVCELAHSFFHFSKKKNDMSTFLSACISMRPYKMENMTRASKNNEMFLVSINKC